MGSSYTWCNSTKVTHFLSRRFMKNPMDKNKTSSSITTLNTYLINILLIISLLIKYLCGAKWYGDSGPFDIKPKAHAEEEEMPEDEWRESRPPNCTAEDDPILNRPKSWERKAPRRPRQSAQE